MQIEIIEMEETRCKFLLKDASPADANALRRTLISDIPKMAIDHVEFHLGPIMDNEKEYESVTPLFDEQVAHRLGLVPIPTDLELMNFREECVCGGEGCPNCIVMYSLNKIGPCTVYSGDLIPLGNDSFRIRDTLIPIVDLNEGQAVLIYATAEMGTAKRHVKWQVTNGVGYNYLPTVEIDYDLCDYGMTCVKSCPRKVFDIVDGKPIVARILDCSICKTCAEDCDQNAITVTADPHNLLFSFETDGSLSAATTLKTALEILEEKFKKFEEMVSSLEN
ncbi:MAG: DNA-directed polymerase subunit [Candidatus Methanomethylophilaceae archaeon]|nr:DNA-directed polymerase subunit [Candidatus Methanomethylophilaceae archaeon]MDI3541746.1 DNA-directed polymerase subunit [Candidatus Methanomethylophilaceae archaeon]HIJ00091.1 DNA-directed RNA polymerase subunit D [Candidatus Methanomethylophilaceae archaeon]